MTEKELLTEVVRLCQKYKLTYHHQPDSRMMMGKPGLPDLIIVGKTLLFAELKTNYGQLSATQTDWRYSLQAAGCHWCKWTPADLDSGEVEHQLSKMMPDRFSPNRYNDN